MSTYCRSFKKKVSIKKKKAPESYPLNYFSILHSTYSYQKKQWPVSRDKLAYRAATFSFASCTYSKLTYSSYWQSKRTNATEVQQHSFWRQATFSFASCTTFYFKICTTQYDNFKMLKITKKYIYLFYSLAQTLKSEWMTVGKLSKLFLGNP